MAKKGGESLTFPSPEEASKIAKKDGEKLLTPVGTQVFKLVKEQMLRSQGKSFAFNINDGHINMYKTMEDEELIKTLATNSSWTLKFRHSSLTDGPGEDSTSYIQVSGTPSESK